MRKRIPCVYPLASKRNGTLYIGVTSDLPARIAQHKANLVPGFTRQYSVHTLVWYEVHPDMPSAIAREKAMKEWKRAWKLALIEEGNPHRHDLSTELGQRAGCRGGRSKESLRRASMPFNSRIEPS